MPSYTNSLLILLGNSLRYLLIQNAIASRARSWGMFEYGLSTSKETSMLSSGI